MVEFETSLNGAAKNDLSAVRTPQLRDRFVNVGDGTKLSLSDGYDSYYSRIFQFCYKRTGDPKLAEDLTSKSFLKVIEQINSGTDYGSFLGVLIRTARNTVVDSYRRDSREKQYFKKYLSKEAFHEESAEDQSNLNKSYVDLYKAMSLITDNQREVIYLRYFEELDYSQIAKIMKKNVEAVKLLRFRGIKKLQKIFELEQNHQLYIVGKNCKGMYLDQNNQEYLTGVQLSKMYKIRAEVVYKNLSELEYLNNSIIITHANFYPADEAIDIIEQYIDSKNNTP